MRRKHAFIAKQQTCNKARLPANGRQVRNALRLNPAIDMTAGKTAKEVI
jgi:hypothetical protein